MVLQTMAPGGRWMKPPHDAPPVYVPAKQTEAHIKRLVSENWMPIEDPRRDDGTTAALPVAEVAMTNREAAMQAQIDQLTALVQQLIAEKEQVHASTQHDVIAHSEDAPDDRRPRRGK